VFDLLPFTLDGIPGTGEPGKSWSALGVLGANIAMMLLGGSIALAVQRGGAPRMPDEPTDP
jgi:hypothetical protein